LTLFPSISNFTIWPNLSPFFLAEPNWVDYSEPLDYGEVFFSDGPAGLSFRNLKPACVCRPQDQYIKTGDRGQFIFLG